jgi:hypothetical protein
MAAAQTLKLTHAVDNKLKEVDDKMNIFIKGGSGPLATY